MKLRRSLTSSLVAIALTLAGATTAIADNDSTNSAEVPDTVLEASEEIGIDSSLDISMEVDGDSVNAIDSDGTDISVSSIGDGSEITVTQPEKAGETSTLVLSGNTTPAEVPEGIAVMESTSCTDTSLAVIPSEDHSVRIHSVIGSAEAPERFDYEFPQADTILVDDDGSAYLFAFAGDDLEPIGAIESPWAVDANGEPVPTFFEAEGNTLTQVVEHTDGNYAYPVTADPKWWDDIKHAFKSANDFLVKKAKSAAKTLGNGSKWLIGKTWKTTKTAGKFVAKKVLPGGAVLCLVGGGWAWYRSDAKGWVRVGDAVVGCWN